MSAGSNACRTTVACDAHALIFISLRAGGDLGGRVRTGAGPHPRSAIHHTPERRADSRSRRDPCSLVKKRVYATLVETRSPRLQAGPKSHLQRIPSTPKMGPRARHREPPLVPPTLLSSLLHGTLQKEDQDHEQ